VPDSLPGAPGQQRCRQGCGKSCCSATGSPLRRRSPVRSRTGPTVPW